MQRILFFIFMYGINTILTAQTYKVFKGDTINRVDKQGLKQGLWRKYYSTDTLFSEGVYKNNFHTGTFSTYHKNGKMQSSLKFRGMSEISSAELFYEDGKTMSLGKYIDHLKDSTWIYYDELGNKNAEENYKSGKKEGVWKIFYQNGKVARVSIYKGDKKNGHFNEYFDSGRLKIEANMRNDEFEGVVKLYHPDGKMWQSGTYKNGNKDGSWIIMDVEGNLEKEEIYKSGILINPTSDEK